MKTDQNYYKYIVVGAGPGGLQMGYFLEKYGKDYLILEKQQTAGSFFKTNPKHRQLISINKKYNYFTEEEFNWRHDWNSLLNDDPEMRFTEYTDELFPNADLLYQYFQDFAARFELRIGYGVTVVTIKKDTDGQFIILTESGEIYKCQVLLMGLGAVASKIPYDIEGIELTTDYEDQPLDLEVYRNKRVGIMGQGNSAFETADYLSGTAAFVHILTKHPVKFAWDTHFVGDLRAVNNNIFDMYQLKSLHAVLSPRITKISKASENTLQTNHEYDFPNASVPGTLKLTREYDFIIRCTGWKWAPNSLFDPDIEPLTWKDGQYAKLSPMWESVNVENLFFIGGAMQGNDRQAASGFIHGYRYNIRTLFHYLEERFEEVPYPHETFAPFDCQKFLNLMYDRFSVSAALFQLYGVLCDVLVVSRDFKEASYYRELPLKYVEEQDFGDRHVLILTLEFGFKKFSEPSLSFMGPSDPLDTSCAAFLHPVIRYMSNGETDKFHFGDSLLARWDRPHGTGGAVMSYHYTFQKWLEEKLGLDLNLPEPTEGGAYHKWSEEELLQWQAKSMVYEPKEESPCKRPI
ncbi:MAG: NAD(P)-binding domain-containing protein [Cyanobacteriota bacterium]|nr:NAD(P)-binding domain-containing protein [Cyanobacteriota bacterium]